MEDTMSDDVQDRQVGFGGGFIEPVFAVRPDAVPEDIGKVTMKDEGKAAFCHNAIQFTANSQQATHAEPVLEHFPYINDCISVTTCLINLMNSQIGAFSMSILVISTSLNPGSRSRVMARQSVADLQAAGVQTDWLDLQETPLRMCDGGAAYGDPALPGVKQQIINATGIIMAVPIYTFDVNAAAKNLIEMTGRDCWTEHVVGFICAAGGQGSYMSVMQLANSLMLDFRTFIVPRFVYATKEATEGDLVVDGDVKQRITQLSMEVVKVSTALRG